MLGPKKKYMSVRDFLEKKSSVCNVAALKVHNDDTGEKPIG